jgi:ABC-type lipoprotein export system ATPase subunit
MQRVAIARALINDPKLILADEPTANLDENNARLVIELLQKIVSQGVSLIVITHDSRISRQFDRILRLQGGRLV